METLPFKEAESEEMTDGVVIGKHAFIIIMIIAIA